MKHDLKTETLLRYLEGRLPVSEREAVRGKLAASAALREELEALRRMQGLLRTAVDESSIGAVRPFLADRVVRRLRTPQTAPAGEEVISGMLSGLFRPFIAFAMVLILALALYNFVTHDYDVKRSAAEAVFGLPPVTLATAYDLQL